jgi:flagellar biosynthesis/type III secretory pathway protein FliH
MPAALSAAPAGVLFAEDFDDAPEAVVVAAPPEPEIIAPVFTLEDIEAVRRRAHAEGRAAAAAATGAAVQAALGEIAATLGRIEAEAEAEAERGAEETSRLLLDILLTLLPATCARHAETEVRAVARAVLPALRRPAAITVRVHPELVPAMRDEIDRFDPDLAGKISVIPVETMTPSDVRANWMNGSAIRDMRTTWREVAAALRSCGLLIDPAVESETDG